jgi:aspartate ammonia-lyase
LEKSTAVATVLAPLLGYEKAAALAQESRRSGRQVLELLLEQELLSEEEMEQWLQARHLTHAGIVGEEIKA